VSSGLLAACAASKASPPKDYDMKQTYEDPNQSNPAAIIDKGQQAEILNSPLSCKQEGMPHETGL